MLKKFLKKIQKMSEDNYYLTNTVSEDGGLVGLSQQTAELELIDTLTNFKLILAHLKDQEEELTKFTKLIRLIAVEEINLTDLKHQFYNYISYQYYTLRSLLWRILLEYLPPRNNKWITKIEATRVNYEKLLNDNLISSIKRRGKEAEGKELKQGGDCKEKVEQGNKMVVNASVDHPLSRNVNSTWNIYFKDHQLWTKIQKDILRTRTKVKFFQQQHEYQLQTVQFNQPLNLSKNKRPCFHHDAVSRILFLYAKLHPETGYSQGMNEIAALIYFVLTNKNTEYQRRVSQSDSYQLFCIVMSRINPQQFSSQEYISQQVKTFCQALKKVDLKLYKILQENKIDLRLVSMRWLMVYMLQEFDINEAILVWDGLLSAEIGVSRYMQYMCLAVMVLKRDQILESPACLYGELGVKPGGLLETAMHLYKEYPNLVA